MKKRHGGWQMWVDLFPDYVIKTPKKKKEIEETVRKFLLTKNKIEELDERVSKMIEEIKVSTKILRKSKVPLELLANLKFIGEGKVKQDRVIALKEKVNNSSEKEMKNLLNTMIKFVFELWKYKIHEKTFKFFTNFGWDGKGVVLIDTFEVTNKKSKVLKQIRKRRWSQPEVFEHYLSQTWDEYFVNQLDKNITEENLNKYWGKKVK